MLSNNMLRNLSNSYGKMSELQDQITSGKKITRPSQDPVVAVKGMGYRRDLSKVEQFTRNMNEVNNWIDSTDEALSQAGDAMNRVRELVVQSANDTNTPQDREKVKQEIDQIRQQLQDIGNTKVADRFIFSGTNTLKPLFVDDSATGGKKINATYTPNNPANVPTNIIATPEITAPKGTVKIEVYDGIQIGVNTSGADLFGNMDALMGKISDLLDSNRVGGPATAKEIGDVLGGVTSSSTDDDITAMHNLVLDARADIGAKQNRVEMMENRLSLREVGVTKQLSNNEDIDYTKAITDMTTYESIHQAALSVGSKIIQQTLVDFMR